MSGIVLVPVCIDALYLDQDQLAIAAMADFSHLPYANHKQEVNPSTANLSEAIVSTPFENQNLYLKAGVHLHWAFPTALTTGVQSADTTNFPAVPDRWLIIRSRLSTNATEIIEKTWIVESDYLYPDGQGDLDGSISIPWTPDTVQGHYSPFRYQGRQMPLDNWLKLDKSADEHVDKLTAVGYGEPTFAAFYPNCHSVFGFFDNEFTGSPDGSRYDVIGWYNDASVDPFAQFLSDILAKEQQNSDPPLSTQDLINAAQHQLQWQINVQEQQAFPDQMICYARLTFDSTSHSSAKMVQQDGTISLALGNTGPEALSAYLASTIHASNSSALKATVETQLEALQLLPQLNSQQLDVDARLAEARHTKSFLATQGGTLWSITTISTQSGPADSSNAQAQLALTLPDTIAAQLNTLNVLQQTYDLAMQKITSQRQQLFADWYRYMLSVYPSDDALGNYPDSDEIMYYLQNKSLAAIEQQVQTTGELTLLADDSGTLVKATSSTSPSRASDLATALNTLLQSLAQLNTTDAVQQAKQSYSLTPMPGPRFWQPREPVALMVGPAVSATDRYNQDDVIQCAVLSNVVAQDILPTQFSIIRDAIQQIDPQSSIGFRTWTQQPWNPFLLEWEVELFPASNQSNIQTTTGDYGADFLTSNYALLENQVELTPRPDNGGVTRAANVYTGSSILTPYAASQLQGQLDAYLQNPLNATTTDVYQHLKAASAILKTDSFTCLSQSLGGFNAALLMHKQTRQLTIDDPLGFDEYQSFTQAIATSVQGENKTAPEPLWDFNPIRSGCMRVTRLRLVDTFGQIQDLQWEQIITTEQMTSSVEEDWIALPPRLSQAARLNFRWLAANSDELEMNDHPATSPVCGWILPNNLDNSVMIYNQTGKLLGFITEQATWNSQAPGCSQQDVSAISNPHLRQMVSYLIAQGAAFFANFITALDTSLANIDPENFAQHQDLALLIGRPIALVRASLNLELQGLPAIHESWNNFRQDLSRTTRNTNKFPFVDVPIRLGEDQQLNDGVVGYWQETTTGDYEHALFYTPQSDPINDPHIVTHASDPAPLRQNLASPALTVSMLLDPRGSAHATCGLLPTKSITIPPDQYVDALKAIEVLFLTTPILTDVGSINMPLPVESGYQWSWETMAGTEEITPVHLQATFSPSQEIREGWLKLQERS
jgi:hypothetical protein